ncbi:small heat shock protein OV25-2-like [Lepeophtheirus salmonis]|uniref:small heat shock protein OV25-2-like n=1 Tax=Lepeophtheirus salmonis TaxID=72036 RepID=UPI001AE5C405|nr:heat shock protein beta-1-like [Lepeophtheirus salmonis]
MSIILHQHPSRVPVTIRDFVWSDLIRFSTWNDFNKTPKKIRRSCMVSTFSSKESQVKKCSCRTRNTMEQKEIKDSQQQSKDTNEALNLFKNKDNQVMQIKEEEDKLEITLDTQQFEPEELQVYVKDGVIHVEAKHEESSENGGKYSAQQWVRKYALPKNTLPETVVANLSSDGLLKIAATKRKEALTFNQITVPIIMNKN